MEISSNLSNFASPDATSVDRTRILNYYEPPSVEVENSAAGWCIIAATRHCLAMD